MQERRGSVVYEPAPRQSLRDGRSMCTAREEIGRSPRMRRSRRAGLPPGLWLSGGWRNRSGLAVADLAMDPELASPATMLVIIGFSYLIYAVPFLLDSGGLPHGTTAEELQSFVLFMFLVFCGGLLLLLLEAMMPRVATREDGHEE